MSVTVTPIGHAQDKNALNSAITFTSVGAAAGDALVVAVADVDVVGIGSLTVAWGSETFTEWANAAGPPRLRVYVAFVAAGGTHNLTATWTATYPTAKVVAAAKISGLSETDGALTAGGGASTGILIEDGFSSTDELLGFVATNGPVEDTEGSWTSPSSDPGQRDGTTGGLAASNVTLDWAHGLDGGVGNMEINGFTSRDVCGVALWLIVSTLAVTTVGDTGCLLEPVHPVPVVQVGSPSATLDVENFIDVIMVEAAGDSLEAPFPPDFMQGNLPESYFPEAPSLVPIQLQATVPFGGFAFHANGPASGIYVETATPVDDLGIDPSTPISYIVVRWRGIHKPEAV